ncbi:MAG: invasion associated locus B family protein [Hoeflea sp.]|uniref:invasion associated locus B family protein n=1 Tax=Hoeflea sp. TaxID=1940281 RepID=UPI00273108BF|nr:invasion associated locus B family protein [Hoeflea sp.]MDP2122042.1 invasion associated locus B family protein [Hoeflea sp.]MDZ7600403.1 invasion associated locus B family protein [Hoeflea sp.]
MFGKTIATAVTALFALTAAAAAQSPTRIQQFDSWGAYSYDSNGGKVCYVLSIPISSAPTNVDHGDIFFLVSQRPGQNVSYEPHAMMGYPLQETSKVTVTVDGRNFTFFTRGSSAWVENAAQEPQLVAAMKAGTSMTVKAVSRRGTDTSYSYSLKGITAALNQIANCR